MSKKVEWYDATSYSQSDTKRVPRTWEIKGSLMEVTVSRHIHFPQDAWVLYCRALDISKFELTNKDLAKAKAEALAHLRVRLKALNHDLYTMDGGAK